MKTLKSSSAQRKILEMIQERTMPLSAAKKNLRVTRLADSDTEETVRLRISATQSLMPALKAAHS
ncbi:hypothetical protein RSK20926_19357 [Roseobacter sp. SK209-2-6]|nr:hypothetical protein RSK20926_19357 [Roseobacter sp. SK209-2-6]